VDHITSVELLDKGYEHPQPDYFSRDDQDSHRRRCVLPGGLLEAVEKPPRVRKQLLEPGLYPFITHARYLFGERWAIGFAQDLPVGIVHAKRDAVV